MRECPIGRPAPDRVHSSTPVERHEHRKGVRPLGQGTGKKNEEMETGFSFALPAAQGMRPIAFRWRRAPSTICAAGIVVSCVWKVVTIVFAFPIERDAER